MDAACGIDILCLYLQYIGVCAYRSVERHSRRLPHIGVACRTAHHGLCMGGGVDVFAADVARVAHGIQADASACRGCICGEPSAFGVFFGLLFAHCVAHRCGVFTCRVLVGGFASCGACGSSWQTGVGVGLQLPAHLLP